MNLVRRWWTVRRLRKHFYEMDKATLVRYQDAAAKKIWSFVRQNSPYYRDLYPFEIPLDQVAPCNKVIMMANFNRITTAPLDRDTLVNFRIACEKKGEVGYFNGNYSIGLSSGTTGNRLLTVLSPEERELYNCLLWARNGIPKSVTARRVLFTLRTNNPAFTEVGRFGVKMVYADYTHPAQSLVELINSRRLNILAGPPSLLSLIAGHYNEIDHPIEAIISYAEVLDDRTRDRLAHTFEAPVVQVYQGAEGFIGTTCRDGRLHLNEDVLLVEPLSNPSDGPVQVLLTDLYRKTQPIIRFQLDDVLELGPEPCSCGSAFQVIRRIHGRADDIFVLLDRQGSPRFLFPDYVRRAINQSSPDILEYQAIQHSPTQMEIRLVLSDETARARIEQQIMANLEWRAEALGAQLGSVAFSDHPPEKNRRSKKLIRVTRRFLWNL